MWKLDARNSTFGQASENILWTARAEGNYMKKVCANRYTLRCCVILFAQMHTQKDLSESGRCPREGRLAIHEITKQIEAYRLLSSNTLRECRDLKINLVCVCVSDRCGVKKA